MEFTGWLTPSGELIKCDGYAHVDKARKIAKELGIYKEDEKPDETLLENGWVRISRLTFLDHGLNFWAYGRMTTIQRQFLRTMFNYDPTALAHRCIENLYAYGIIEEYERPDYHG